MHKNYFLGVELTHLDSGAVCQSSLLHVSSDAKYFAWDHGDAESMLMSEEDASEVPVFALHGFGILHDVFVLTIFLTLGNKGGRFIWFEHEFSSGELSYQEYYKRKGSYRQIICDTSPRKEFRLTMKPKRSQCTLRLRYNAIKDWDPETGDTRDPARCESYDQGRLCGC